MNNVKVVILDKIFEAVVVEKLPQACSNSRLYLGNWFDIDNNEYSIYSFKRTLYAISK